MPDAPAATLVLSTTSTRSPRWARCQAVERPCTPAPTTSTGTDEGSVVMCCLSRNTVAGSKLYTNSFTAARLAADFPSRGANREMSVVEGNGNLAVEPVGHTFGGTVDDVLRSSRIAPAPATLEEARNAPGRREKIQAITERIERDGIKYVFFQQVSVTGRVMGKGVVATFFPQVAEKGYQLVYGA